MINTRTPLAALTVVVAASAPAHADVKITTAATQNMSCSGGVCVPTAAQAVFNATDLQNDLSQYGNVTIKTTGSGVEANNIVVDAAFSSPDSTSLKLDAHSVIIINASVSIGSGTAELELQSDTLDANQMLSFRRKAHITFGSLSDLFGINGGIFTLVGSVQGLASAVAANPSGSYALANDYDASADGAYGEAPVQTVLAGTFEGLGNVIANLEIDDQSGSNAYVGLFSQVNATGTIRDIGLKKVNIGGNNYAFAGALVAGNQGLIVNAYATGVVSNYFGQPIGGLVAENSGTVEASYAAVRVIAGGDSDAGGLVGLNGGQINASFATGDVSGGETYFSNGVGGLVGTFPDGTITNSYATGHVTASRHNTYSVGGLIGFQYYYGHTPSASTSYSTGAVKNNTGKGKVSGGSIGYRRRWGTNTDLYWDTTTSGTFTGVGHGPTTGVTGLTTQQLQSSLPTGFDPSIWAESPNINNGLPYLIANPPPK